MKKRWILNSLSYRHKLTSFEHLQVNQETLNEELNSHEDGGCLCSDHPWSHLLWHRKSLVWGEQSFPNLEGIIQLEQRHWWDTELYWQPDKIHFLFLFRCFLHHLKTWSCKAAACSRSHHTFFIAGTFAYCLLASQTERIRQEGNLKYQWVNISKILAHWVQRCLKKTHDVYARVTSSALKMNAPLRAWCFTKQ